MLVLSHIDADNQVLSRSTDLALNLTKLFSPDSVLDVQRWTFDVRCSSFETSPYGINATCEHLQNNLALMGFSPAAGRGSGQFERIENLTA